MTLYFWNIERRGGGGDDMNLGHVVNPKERPLAVQTVCLVSHKDIDPIMIPSIVLKPVV